MLSPEELEDVRRGMRIAGQMSLGLLVKGDFDVLEAMTSGRHMSAEELQQAVDSLGGRVIELPEEEWSHIPLRPRADHKLASFDFVVPLWTAEGRTSTGMALHLVPTTYGTFEVEIEGFVPVEAGPRPEGAGKPTQARAAGSAEGGQPLGNPVPERWRPLLADIVHRLVVGDYAGLAADGLVSYTDDPSDATIGRWIEDYPAKLVELPPEAWRYSEYGRRIGAPQSWWVIVDLWTAEEGRSDLSMEATIWDDGTSVTAKVDNVHVM